MYLFQNWYVRRSGYWNKKRSAAADDKKKYILMYLTLYVSYLKTIYSQLYTISIYIAFLYSFFLFFLLFSTFSVRGIHSYVLVSYLPLENIYLTHHIASLHVPLRVYLCIYIYVRSLYVVYLVVHFLILGIPHSIRRFHIFLYSQKILLSKYISL
jgi:hypothetical protein